ncbi:unnamed protein product [Durusdinium trenchii]|uniref:Uncharacterized protein n=1 Tax=Durusdinium trenchii TaxID=1381693 RepID=A0ABP0SRI5_9DINO
MVLTEEEQKELQEKAKEGVKQSAGSSQRAAGGMSDASKRRLDDKSPAEEFELVAPFDEELGYYNLYDTQETAIPLPKDCETTTQWGSTKLMMEKYRAEDLSYEKLVLRALRGDKEADRYCRFIMNKYGTSTMVTQGPDFAKFLLRVKYEQRKRIEGYVRTFVK